VGAAALLFTGLVLTLAVRRSLRPLGAVCERIAAIDARDLTARLDAARVPDELLPVVQRVNDLLARLDGAFARERAFSNDVAHELRTPLAGLRTLLEVTATRPRTEADYAAALRDGARLVEQLQAMVDRLLQLARLDAGLAPLARERVDLADLLPEAWDPFAAQATARGLRVDWRLDEGVVVDTDRRLLETVLRNLLENAVTYADEGGRVQIVVRREETRLVVEVANTGSQLSPEQVALAPQRFWRGAASRTEAGVHCGRGRAPSAARSRCAPRSAGSSWRASRSDARRGSRASRGDLPPGVRAWP
jgi:two-component system, OmpR family, heavy metal sensor histidine kinase CusS